MRGGPLWPPTVPRLAARSSQSNPRGSGPDVLKRERGHVTSESGVPEVGPSGPSGLMGYNYCCMSSDEQWLSWTVVKGWKSAHGWMGNSPVSGEFPAQRPVTRSFDVFFDLRMNERLSKRSRGWWLETPSHPLWRQSNDWKLWIWLLTHGLNAVDPSQIMKDWIEFEANIFTDYKVIRHGLNASISNLA